MHSRANSSMSTATSSGAARATDAPAATSNNAKPELSPSSPLSAGATTHPAASNDDISSRPNQSANNGGGNRLKQQHPLRAVSKRPLLTHTKDGQELSEKKLRRLEKNRLSARECRRRKREATEHLERHINVLEGENLRLRLQLQIGAEAQEAQLKEQEALTCEIDELLKSGAPEQHVHNALEAFKEKYADYGRDRRTAIQFHLAHVERLLMPTQTTTVVMHAIQGGDVTAAATATASNTPAQNADHQPARSAAGSLKNDEEEENDDDIGMNIDGGSSHSTTAGSRATSSIQSDTIPTHPSVDTLATSSLHEVSKPSLGPVAAVAAAEGQLSSSAGGLDPKALFAYLVQHLQVTPAQAAALKDSRKVAQEMDGCLDQALQVVQELRTRLAQTGEDLETEFNNVRAVLTPSQAAKFLVWVAHNDAAMHMLNELWNRVYPTSSITDHDVENILERGGGGGSDLERTRSEDTMTSDN